MREYKTIQFGERFEGTLTEFKKTFKTHLKYLSDGEVKEAHKEAIKKISGNISKPIRKSNQTDTSEGKK